MFYFCINHRYGNFIEYWINEIKLISVFFKSFSFKGPLKALFAEGESDALTNLLPFWLSNLNADTIWRVAVRTELFLTDIYIHLYT